MAVVEMMRNGTGNYMLNRMPVSGGNTDYQVQAAKKHFNRVLHLDWRTMGMLAFHV